MANLQGLLKERPKERIEEEKDFSGREKREDLKTELELESEENIEAKATELSKNASSLKEYVDHAIENKENIGLFEFTVFVVVKLLQMKEEDGASLPQEVQNYLGELDNSSLLNPEDDNFRDYDHTPEDLIDESRFETLNEAQLRTRIVDAAYSVVESIEFRGSEVRGGSLACAQVVSRVLSKYVNPPVLDKEYLGVGGTMNALEEKGWIARSGWDADPGDIIIWNPLPSGHKHIGISLGNGRAMSNSSRKKYPRIHDIGTPGGTDRISRRGILAIYSPPSSSRARR